MCYQNPNVGKTFFNKIFSESEKVCKGFSIKVGGFLIEN